MTRLGTHIEQLSEHLIDIRYMIDRIDETEFGKLDAHFDQMAIIADKAIDHAQSALAKLEADHGN